MGDFGGFAFSATGSTAPRTLPDRLAEVKNVRDFGAVGDGVTDDWAAIMAAFNWTTNTNRGTIYFPPGNYLVSQPVNFFVAADPNVTSQWLGELGLSIITGNFPDYVLSRGANDTGSSDGGHVVEKLTIINKHPTGGGIRLGYAVGGAIRNCSIVANTGIDTVNIDSLIGGGFYWGSMEVSIENCTLTPGANVAGSQGILACSNGPIMNCRIIGFATGMHLFGGEGAMSIMGCYFEQNGVGLLPGVGPNGNATNAAVGQYLVSGCWFKNNGTAIQVVQTSRALFEGIRIEGANGKALGGANPQYGISIAGGQAGATLFRGVIVTGQYDVAGISITGGEQNQTYNSFMGVQSYNTGAGTAWQLPSTALTAQFISCNVAPVYTMSQLPVPSLTVVAASYNSATGLATITCSMPSTLGSFYSANTWNIAVTGVILAGYNGTFVGTPVAYNQLTYPVASNPGGSASGGSVRPIAVNAVGEPCIFEGDCYNVRDANFSTWGSAPTAGGSGHAKVRWKGTNWAVIGK